MLMIPVAQFYKALNDGGIDFFAGVPDSLLKDICAYITEHAPGDRHIITANEGGAVALGAGYHLATGKIPLIYMQNSGIGNAVNPLLSLADREVYSLPMLVMIGWRGEPGVKDEPQHIKQGRVLPALLDAMELPYLLLDQESDFSAVLKEAREKALALNAPVALLVRKGAFEPYALKKPSPNLGEMSREAALEEVLNHLPADSVVVSTTGMLSRELFELREKKGQGHERDFLTVGSMGHTLPIAMGLALAQKERPVYCLDGDGSVLMHLGAYAVAGQSAPANLRVVLFNNAAHDSVGGQPTVGDKVDFEAVARGCGIGFAGKASDEAAVAAGMTLLNQGAGLALLELRIRKGARSDLGRPTESPKSNKSALMQFLKRHE